MKSEEEYEQCTSNGSTFNQGSLETQKPRQAHHTAVEVSAPNQLRVVERRVLNLGQVKSDSGGGLPKFVTRHDHCTGTYPGLTLPRVPDMK